MTEAEIVVAASKLLADVQFIYSLIDQAIYQGEDNGTDPNGLTTLLEIRRRFDPIEGQIADLTHLVRRMASQRQSAVESFIKGWEAGLLDLQDKLSRYEFDQLIKAINAIEAGER